MTEEEIKEIATRVAMEELAPVINVRREAGYDTHEVCLQLPFEDYWAMTINLADATPAKAERAFRSMCRSAKWGVSEALRKKEADEQERYAREAIARRLAGD